jgi:hypothetical protein
MNRLLAFLVGLLLLSTVSGAQRSDFRHGSYGGGGSYSPGTLTGNFLIGGLALGWGLGLEYEYAFGERGTLSVNVPVVFSKAKDGFMTVASAGDYYHYYSTFFIAPGVRFHPAGSFHRADFSIGGQIAIGSVNTREELITGTSTPTTTASSLMVAPMGNMNLNITARDGFVFGLYWGVGPAVSGTFGTHEQNGAEKNPEKALFLMGIKLGGRL